LTHEAGYNVVAPTCGKEDDQMDRPYRIIERQGGARQSRKRGCTCCQMQNIPAMGKFHGVL
jgi:hypothetical protein